MVIDRKSQRLWYLLLIWHTCKLFFINLFKICSRATILVKLQKDDPSQLPFEPGDHIGIYPCNDPQMVKGTKAIFFMSEKFFLYIVTSYSLLFVSIDDF